MKKANGIVATGGWVKREYRTRPFTLLVGSMAFLAGVTTGICAAAVVVLWRVDGIVPHMAVRWTLVGIPVTALLVALTAVVAKREPERTIFKYKAVNPEYDPKKLY